MTKISQIVTVAPSVVLTDKIELETAAGVSEQSTIEGVRDTIRDNLEYIILKSANSHRWKFIVGDDGMLAQPGEDLGI